MNLNQKYEAAIKAHDDAMVGLERERVAYDSVEPTYADLRAKLEELQQSKCEQLEVMAAAKERLSAAMVATMGRLSGEAKDALAARRTAEDLVDQFSELETVAAAHFPEVQIRTSQAAKSYLFAYDRAVATWAEKNALGILLECGERLAEAMTVRRRGVQDPLAVKVEDREHSPCRKFVLHELGRLCERYGNNPTPYADVIPEPQLGTFSKLEVLSPAAIMRMS